MNIELTLEQSQKADLLLKELCESDSVFDREEADKIFKSPSESNFVCLTLKQMGLLDIIAQTENNLLYRFTKTDIACGFLENGGLTKIATDREKQQTIKEKDDEIRELTTKNLRLQNKQLKRAVLYSIIGFIAGAIISNLKDILILLNITNQ